MPTAKRRLVLSKPASSERGGWHLLSDEDLFAERRRLLDRQRRFMEIAAAINTSDDPDHVLMLVRDAVIQSGMFDRAGVWVMDDGYFHGAWGTDPHGVPRSEHEYRQRLEDWGPLIPQLLTGEKSYVIKTWIPEEEHIPAGSEVEHAIVVLRAGKTLLGVLSVDNLLTQRKVTEEDVEQLLPFANMAAAAIHGARMARERDRLAERQRRMMQLASGINASLDLATVLRFVHNAVVETAGFDRTAVFQYDPLRSEVRGAWGTDRQGNIVDGSDWKMSIEENRTDDPLWRVLTGKIPFHHSEDLTAQLRLPDAHHMHGVRAHAIVPMVNSGEVLGVICVDNLLTDRDIREEEIAALLPFAEQAALAIRNARLFQELQTAQGALVRSENLRALGELAGGVAHNINNLLTAVLGYAELIRRDPENTEKVVRYASIIENAGMDGAEIVRRVQQFAQQQTSASFEVIDLGEVVRAAVDLTRPYWRDHAEARTAGITVKTEVDIGVAIPGVASELREVVVNLVRNAVDAMPTGGQITIRCRVDRGEALLEVKDSGSGMSEATRKRIFEPFFTTKGPALGLGLGLSVAWGIIVRHNGKITVDSRPGGGTRFRVAFPLADPPQVETPVDVPEEQLQGLRILVVDDEPFVLDSLARTLECAGAVVHTEERAESALAWLDENPHTCDVALSDHGMPGMTGLAFLAAVRERHPTIVRALISGWGATPPAGADLGPAQTILSKPITHDKLVHSLDEVIRTAATE